MQWRCAKAPFDVDGDTTRTMTAAEEAVCGQCLSASFETSARHNWLRGIAMGCHDSKLHAPSGHLRCCRSHTRSEPSPCLKKLESWPREGCDRAAAALAHVVRLLGLSTKRHAARTVNLTFSRNDLTGSGPMTGCFGMMAVARQIKCKAVLAQCSM